MLVMVRVIRDRHGATRELRTLMTPGDAAPGGSTCAGARGHRRRRQAGVAAALRGKKNVVLYFYPADFSAVCTRETCAFRDAYKDLADGDTEVIGVSVDDDATHREFARAYQLPFALVGDPGLAIARRSEATGGLMGRAAQPCPACEGRMRLVALIRNPASIARYLAGTFEPTELPPRSPDRGPPYWASTILRRKAPGAEPGDDFVRAEAASRRGTQLITPYLRPKWA
jgi:hypothetical protein